MTDSARVQDSTATVKRLTALAQLIAMHSEHGVTTTAALVEATGYSERAIRKARAELECRNRGAANGTRVPEPGCRSGTGVPEAALECRSMDAPAEGVHKATRATKESPTEIAISKIDSPLYPSDPYDRVKVENGRLVLFNGLRQFWLDKFGGDEERLTLALTQASAYVQTASRRPLEAQVSAQLARIAGEKRDRDARYAQAAAQNRSAPRSSGFVQQEDSGSRIRRLLAARSEGGVQ